MQSIKHYTIYSGTILQWTLSEFAQLKLKEKVKKKSKEKKEKKKKN